MPPRQDIKADFQKICNLLIKKDMITKSQTKEALNKFDTFKRKLEKIRTTQHKPHAADLRIENPITAVDILAEFKLKIAHSNNELLDEEALLQILANEWGFAYKKIDPLKLDLNLVTTTIPRSFAMKHIVLPISMKNGKLVVATSNPFNREAIEDISRVSQLKVEPVVSTKTDIIRLIDEFFGFKRSIAAAEIQFDSPTVDLGNLEQYVRLKSAEELPSNDQHIVNAVNHLLNYAYEQRASDIHIEPKRDISLVRMRIDGILHSVYRLPKKVHLAIVSRIKNLSRLDMTEKRRPQDGRIKTVKEEKEIEIRVSTIPVAFGEKVVMRIMDPDILFQDLKALGFHSEDLTRFKKIISMPHGIVLVCGPTGSGKSTTLYSTLRFLSTPEINITSIEDPIEMIHEDFNQIAVQPAVNITFATILRNILRQDPDIIMIGEMRDLETAENAIQASMTGHLVLSTLHTNDAPSSITRLIDLGIKPFLIQETLIGTMAQRLVRKICPRCCEEFEMDVTELRHMGFVINQEGRIRLKRGHGCLHCRGTGYRGRIGIFEVLPFSEAIKKATHDAANIKEIRDIAKREGMFTLREDATRKILSGVTTFQEALRVTWENY